MVQIKWVTVYSYINMNKSILSHVVYVHRKINWQLNDSTNGNDAV